MDIVWIDDSRATEVLGNKEQTAALLSKCDIFRTVTTLSPDCKVSLVRNGHLGVEHIAIRIKEKKRKTKKDSPGDWLFSCK